MGGEGSQNEGNHHGSRKKKRERRISEGLRVGKIVPLSTKLYPAQTFLTSYAREHSHGPGPDERGMCGLWGQHQSEAELLSHVAQTPKTIESLRDELG